ncbi:DUF3500 domain-containing protein [Pseudozobellia thermophila]|uniref:DUF3500 domain-containing protein n=1 Tax=Pseudozobellia thermophila TaxID=192903 RepID=A0A1M6MKP0_9FLAO|nr:DUF3500 domain-containing protein [Pseudozobellia thermophila]SHJ84038.1 Protein of unknown function [Pseudozobellia thermophila]
MKRKLIALLVIIQSFVFNDINAQDLHRLAIGFLETLGPELREKTLYELSSEEREMFYYTPVYRKGSTLKEYTDEQKTAALALLRASISSEAYRKTQEIMELENILLVLENNPKMPDGTAKRDPLNYHFWIFGNPAQDQFWGWRFEGHHISLNFVASEGRLVSSTPFFLGSNPARVLEGEHKGHEILKKETDLGYAMVNSLTPEQLKVARFSDTAPADMFTSNHTDIAPLNHSGIKYSALLPEQQQAFKNLLQLYLDHYEAKFSKEFKKKIKKQGLDELTFAWAGSLERGEGHYYSIQGPSLLIEYDNTQNNNNHVHTVVRDLENDFGKDVLKEHYAHDHH